MVDREVELSFEDIRRRDLVEKTITMTCVFNVVGGYLVSTSNFVGVPLRELLMEAGVQDEARQPVGRASDGSRAALRWTGCCHPNGKPYSR